MTGVGMLRPLLTWLVRSAALLLVVSGLTFVLMSLTPGDTARSILGTSGTAEQHALLRERLGIDQPLAVQFGNWLSGAVHGDLGNSLITGEPVVAALNQRLGVTLVLIVGSVLVATVVGVGMGIASALRGGALGRTVDAVSLLGAAIPNYWLGLVLIAVFAVALRLFPTGGYVSPGESVAAWFGSIVLPVLTLGLGASGVLAKQTRDAMLDELARDYIVLLRARSVPEWRIVIVHALRNAGVPIVTVLGLLFVGLLSGTVLAETVFVLPGLGGFAVTATSMHDIPVVQGIALYFTVVVILVNLAVELGYGWLNPRSRT